MGVIFAVLFIAVITVVIIFFLRRRFEKNKRASVELHQPNVLSQSKSTGKTNLFKKQ